MKSARFYYSLAVLSLVTVSCSVGDGSQQSLSAEGVVACSKKLFWATKAEVEGQAGSSIRIRVNAKEWLEPTSGPEALTLTVINPETKTRSGFPTEDWTANSFLVVVPDAGEPYALANSGAQEIADAVETGRRKSCPAHY